MQCLAIAQKQAFSSMQAAGLLIYMCFIMRNMEIMGASI